MAVLTDLFVSDPLDAPAYASSQQGGAALKGRFVVASHKGFTDLEFSTLFALIANEEWDLDKHQLENVEFGSEGETWLFQFPSRLMVLLKGMNAEAIDEAASAWAATEELNCAASDVRPTIVDLQRLSEMASSQSNGLFLWGSL